MSVHFVSIDEVAEQAYIGVGVVVGFVKDQVGVVAQVGVEGVVLQMGRV